MIVDETFGTFADSHSFERSVVEVQLRFGQGVRNVPQLVRVDPHVVIGDEAGDELAIERIVSGIQCTDTPVSIVISVHAHAEWTIFPEGRRSPVIAVVTEAVHFLVITLSVVSVGHGFLSVQFSLSALLLAVLFNTAPGSLANFTIRIAKLTAGPFHIARTQTRSANLSVPPAKKKQTNNTIKKITIN